MDISTHLGRAVLGDFITQTTSLLSRGCLLPLTSTGLHIIQLNAHIMDRGVIISDEEIIVALEGIGFDQMQIHFYKVPLLEHFRPLTPGVIDSIGHNMSSKSINLAEPPTQCLPDHCIRPLVSREKAQSISKQIWEDVYSCLFSLHSTSHIERLTNPPSIDTMTLVPPNQFPTTAYGDLSGQRKSTTIPFQDSLFAFNRVELDLFKQGFEKMMEVVKKRFKSSFPSEDTVPILTLRAYFTQLQILANRHYNYRQGLMASKHTKSTTKTTESSVADQSSTNSSAWKMIFGVDDEKWTENNPQSYLPHFNPYHHLVSNPLPLSMNQSFMRSVEFDTFTSNAEDGRYNQAVKHWLDRQVSPSYLNPIETWKQDHLDDLLSLTHEFGDDMDTAIGIIKSEIEIRRGAKNQNADVVDGSKLHLRAYKHFPHPIGNQINDFDTKSGQNQDGNGNVVGSQCLGRDNDRNEGCVDQIGQFPKKLEFESFFRWAPRCLISHQDFSSGISVSYYYEPHIQARILEDTHGTGSSSSTATSSSTSTTTSSSTSTSTSSSSTPHPLLPPLPPNSSPTPYDYIIQTAPHSIELNFDTKEKVTNELELDDIFLPQAPPASNPSPNPASSPKPIANTRVASAISSLIINTAYYKLAKNEWDLVYSCWINDTEHFHPFSQSAGRRGARNGQMATMDDKTLLRLFHSEVPFLTKSSRPTSKPITPTISRVELSAIIGKDCDNDGYVKVLELNEIDLDSAQQSTATTQTDLDPATTAEANPDPTSRTTSTPSSTNQSSIQIGLTYYRPAVLPLNRQSPITDAFRHCFYPTLPSPSHVLHSRHPLSPASQFLPLMWLHGIYIMPFIYFGNGNKSVEEGQHNALPSFLRQPIGPNRFCPSQSTTHTTPTSTSKSKHLNYPDDFVPPPIPAITCHNETFGSIQSPTPITTTPQTDPTTLLTAHNLPPSQLSQQKWLNEMLNATRPNLGRFDPVGITQVHKQGDFNLSNFTLLSNFNCPVTFIVLILNPVQGEKALPAPKKNAPLPVPLNKYQYQYFQQNIPPLYKRQLIEQMFMIGPAGACGGSVEKLNHLWNVEVATTQTISNLLQNLELKAVETRLNLLRKAFNTHRK
jgi:hypothetical protein